MFQHYKYFSKIPNIFYVNKNTARFRVVFCFLFPVLTHGFPMVMKPQLPLVAYFCTSSGRA